MDAAVPPWSASGESEDRVCALCHEMVWAVGDRGATGCRKGHAMLCFAVTLHVDCSVWFRLAVGARYQLQTEALCLVYSQ